MMGQVSGWSFLILLPLSVFFGCSSLWDDSKSDLEEALSRNPEFHRLREGVAIEMLSTGDRLVLGATEDFYSGFPDTLPVVPGALPNNRTILPEGVQTFTFSTEASWPSVEAFYRNTAHFSEAGWNLRRQEQNDQAHHLEIGKDGLYVLISAVKRRDATGADIGYAVGREERPPR